MPGVMPTLFVTPNPKLAVAFLVAASLAQPRIAEQKSVSNFAINAL
jgi:hypothetical protein